MGAGRPAAWLPVGERAGTGQPRRRNRAHVARGRREGEALSELCPAACAEARTVALQGRPQQGRRAGVCRGVRSCGAESNGVRTKRAPSRQRAALGRAVGSANRQHNTSRQAGRQGRQPGSRQLPRRKSWWGRQPAGEARWAGTGAGMACTQGSRRVGGLAGRAQHPPRSRCSCPEPAACV